MVPCYIRQSVAPGKGRRRRGCPGGIGMNRQAPTRRYRKGVRDRGLLALPVSVCRGVWAAFSTRLHRGGRRQEGENRGPEGPGENQFRPYCFRDLEGDRRGDS